METIGFRGNVWKSWALWKKNKQVIAVEEATSTYKWLSDFPK